MIFFILENGKAEVTNTGCLKFAYITYPLGLLTPIGTTILLKFTTNTLNSTV